MDFLKRLVFKIIICCERIEYFISGTIRARNSTLGLVSAKIKDRTSDSLENPFIVGEPDLKVNENPAIEDKDILRTYCL